eukprot:COSAG06_NODE_18404_length_889_cov_1.432911_1_plen_77_part_00
MHIPAGDVALRFWVRDDGDGDVAPARGLSRTAKVDGEWTEDEGAADKVRNAPPPPVLFAFLIGNDDFIQTGSGQTS